MVNLLLGAVSEMFVTVGVVLGLFVVWQLWWTNVEAGETASVALRQLDDVAAAPADGAGADVIEEHEKRTNPVHATLTAPAGEVFAALRVPEWGEQNRTPIAEGVAMQRVLDLGIAGHYPETALPGEVGNFALAAHRQSHGAAFRRVDRLTPGDTLVVETAEDWFVYEVTGSRIVTPWEDEVLAPVPGDPTRPPAVASITLTTCHPLFSTRERFIVHGKLSWWAPRAAGTPEELLHTSRGAA